jgi:microfibrillar-associated protein 1
MFTTMLYNGSSGRAGVSMPSTVIPESKRLDPIGWVVILIYFAMFVFQIALNYLRLLCLSLPFWRPKNIEGMTFAQWAEHTVPNGYLARLTGWDASWRDFTQRILTPLFSAVCTTSEEDVMEHPVEEMLGTYLSHFFLFPSWQYLFMA